MDFVVVLSTNFSILIVVSHNKKTNKLRASLIMSEKNQVGNFFEKTP